MINKGPKGRWRIYSELHCKTNFSFLEGASHADELVRRAAELGYGALAITDRNTLAGVVRAHTAAKDHNLKLLIGAEIHLVDALPVVLWAPDREAYGRLSRLITVGRLRAEKGECRLTWNDLVEQQAGLLAGVWIPPLQPTSLRLCSAKNIRRAWAWSSNCSVIGSCLGTAVICWPSCIADPMISGDWSSAWPGRAGQACRWWPLATCTITRPHG